MKKLLANIKSKKNSMIFLVISHIFIFSPCLLGEPVVPGSYGSNTSTPAINQLPQVKTIVQGISAIEQTADNQLEIRQAEEKAIIDWESFNIGENASTKFIQRDINGVPQISWSALNRIYDQNPSQILGQLTADGKVYLINQNGILFGPGARINIHSLIASTLDINEETWLNQGRLTFRLENNAPFDSVIANHGFIETEDGGAVFLFAPFVENYGTINAPIGQIGLAAGTEIEILSPFDLNPGTSRSARVVNVKTNPGEATNFETGELITDLGLTGIYGRIVKQEGLIRSVTAVKRNGNIELLATEKVTTGEHSITACPISDSPEVAHESFTNPKGSIVIEGLDPENPLPQYNKDSRDKVDSVELNGVIEAPSGKVDITAEKRVYMANGSRINVSGEWAVLPAENNILETQLNSVELRDDYGQKEGILTGENITFHAYNGSSIGNISGSLTSEEQSAIEKNTTGGNVSIEATSGEIILRDGALIDFSGGGIYYDEGLAETTKLLSGNQIYDISAAPQWIEYDKIMGLYVKKYPLHGITDEYKGIYYGGAAPIMTYQPPHIEGHDAGSLILKASALALDGLLDGSVILGPFQTELFNPQNTLGFSIAKGIVQPVGGRLHIGYYDFLASFEGRDLFTGDIIVMSETEALPESFGPEDLLTNPSQSLLSSGMLNDARLSELKLFSNTVIVTNEDARICLAPNGNFQAVARSIFHMGEINVPSGDIKLICDDNKTSETLISGGQNPGYVPLPDYLPEGIFLEEGSKLIAAGEKKDYILQQTLSNIHGGGISIHDRTFSQHDIHIAQGSLIDVSGGFSFDNEGAISGGDAGIIELKGTSLNLEGDLKGQALWGNSGGMISIHTDDIRVVQDRSLFSEINDEALILSHDFFAPTGFTHIALTSENDLNIENNAYLAPSQTKIEEPSPILSFNSQYANTIGISENFGSGSLKYTTVPFELLGSSSINCSAGATVERTGNPQANLLASINVKSSGKIEASAGGSINMTAPGIKMEGIIEVPAGNITISATEQDLIMGNDGQILAPGFNMPDAKPIADGLQIGFNPLPGGNIKLEARKQDTGSIIMLDGFLMDVSGSMPVQTTIQNTDGSLAQLTSASDAGCITLSFGGYLNPEKDADEIIQSHGKLGGVKLLGHTSMAGATGGELTLEHKNTNIGLNIYPDDMINLVKKTTPYESGGFDALTLRSWTALDFTGSLSLSLARRLTLDAPLISASASSQIDLLSPWLSLTNTSGINSLPLSEGNGSMVLSGDWLDIEGEIDFSGFRDIQFKAVHDIRLSDRFYRFQDVGLGWHGGLNTKGDLIIQGARIYPTTLSRFTIHSDKNIAILPGEEPPSGPIYSAGGVLNIEGKNINNWGYLAAPMGNILLCQDADEEDIHPADRIYMAEGSLISVTGDAQVEYGDLFQNTWIIPNKESKSNENQIASTPYQSVSVYGKEVIQSDGADIHADAGGGIFTYQFMQGIEGTRNPISENDFPDRFVILPDNSIDFPGEAIYLEGINGISEGIYSVLPGNFAFMPGAMVLEDLGISLSAKNNIIAEDSSPVTRGFTCINGTNFRTNIPRWYSVKPAEQVLSEGHFMVASSTSGDGGAIKIEANTAILEGNMSGKAVSGYKDGQIELGGKNILAGSDFDGFLKGFSFEDEIPEYFQDKLYIDTKHLSEGGFSEICLGLIKINGSEYNGTANVIVQNGGVLEGKNITITATDAITLEQGSQIHASGDIENNEGSLNLISPEGDIIIEEGSLVHIVNALNMQCNRISLEGDIEADNSALNLAGDRIIIAAQLPDEQTENGLIFTPSNLAKLTSGFSDISFAGQDSFIFRTTLDMEFGDNFIIDTPRIIGEGLAEGDQILVSSDNITFLNSWLPYEGEDLPDASAISLNAKEFVIGHGDIVFDGFKKIDLSGEGDLILSGKGSLTTSSKELNLKAARITTSSYQEETLSSQDENLSYEASDFTINVPYGDVAIKKSDGVKGDNTVPGGYIELKANNIVSEGIIEVQSGQIVLNANGEGEGQGIFLKDGSEILAIGSEYAQGGRVYLNSDKGNINIEKDAIIDVSAGNQGDAGILNLYSPQGYVFLNGEILGSACGGIAGSFTLDSRNARFDEESNALNLSELIQKLTDGGFNNSIELHVRGEDRLILEEDDQLEAHEIKLVNDGGDVEIKGVIKAFEDHGQGRIELFASDDLILHSSMKITDINNQTSYDTGIYALGGEVIMGSANGKLILGTPGLDEPALIDISDGGSVILQASRNDEKNDVQIQAQAVFQGGSQVIVEAFETYDETSGYIDDQGMLVNLDGLKASTADFMNNAQAIKDRIISGLSIDDEGLLHVRPGIEIAYDGTLSLSSDLILTDDLQDGTGWHFGGEPGILSLRACGDLNINHNLVDKSLADSSWRLNLIAGAELGSADPSAVLKGSGNINIGDGTAVYTKHAAISFASGKDTTIGYLSKNYAMSTGNIPFNIASYDSPIKGSVEGSLFLNGGAIQTATGDIEIELGENLVFGTYFDSTTKNMIMGSIRTLGELPSDFDTTPYSTNQLFWEYKNGGDITIRSGGKIGAPGGGLFNVNAWDRAYDYNIKIDGKRVSKTAWSASYDGQMAAQGIATMAGGDLTVSSGGSLFAQIGTFGKGDLTLFSGGDLDGKFLVKDGECRISSLGNFGENTEDLAIEAFDTQISVTAQGNIHLGTILNPTIARDGFNGAEQWNLTYSTDSSVILRANTGDVIMSGLTKHFSNTLSSDRNRERILPPKLEIYALRDIHLSNTFAMAPSETGNLVLMAGRDIDGFYKDKNTFRRSSIFFSDLNPSTIFGEHSGERDVNNQIIYFSNNLFQHILHAKSPIHKYDNEPVIIEAGNDIHDMRLFLSKKANIIANRNIMDIEYIGQNILPYDTTTIRAGNDICFSNDSLVIGETGIEQGGPGALFVMAGNSIDLGTSKGIQSVGHFYNPALKQEEGSLAVIAGFDLEMDEIDDKHAFFNDFFEAIKTEGLEYSKLLNEGEIDLAAGKINEIKETILCPLFQNTVKGEGDINMLDSQINSSGESGNLSIIAKGDVNVGRTTFSTNTEGTKNSGIYTAAGGSIGIYAEGDINVNESRVMTFRGGDISIWSDNGDINAGRGSKTAINTEPPKLDISPEGEVLGVKFEPPAVGSGIRTLTYDPDGFEGPALTPLAGDIFLFAPKGEIDAGEAGISGRNITMAANAYKNVQNVDFSEGSLGVPSISESGQGIGALTGAGGLAETTKITEETAVLDSAQKRLAESIEKIAEAFSLNWLIKVEFIGFDDFDDKNENENGEKHKR
ncbi:filamentous hemagglutinin family protein [bacterium]|nr:filamentous hemagglutinin family protein [bacterium]